MLALNVIKLSHTAQENNLTTDRKDAHRYEIVFICAQLWLKTFNLMTLCLHLQSLKSQTASHHDYSYPDRKVEINKFD